MVAKVATPLLRVPEPSTVEPSLNVTVPVGMPEPGGAAATVAVNATCWPIAATATFDCSATVVAALVTFIEPVTNVEKS